MTCGHACSIRGRLNVSRLTFPASRSPAFTLVEILIAIGILGMVLAAIFSS